MLVLLFWMTALCQVAISHLIHWRRFSRSSEFTLALAASQRQDDIFACLIMGASLMARNTQLAGGCYLIATLTMVWLSRRAKQRLDLLAARG